MKVNMITYLFLSLLFIDRINSAAYTSSGDCTASVASSITASSYTVPTNIALKSGYKVLIYPNKYCNH